MSYCVRCGVELENGTPACPLCQTPVIDPTAPPAEPVRPLYPHSAHEGIPKVSSRAKFILLSILLAIPTFVTLTCDISLSGGITWSGYVLEAVIALLGTAAIGWFVPLPAWSKVLMMGAIWSAYTFFVEYRIHGKLGFPFSLPIVLYGVWMLSMLCLYGWLTRRNPRPLVLTAHFFVMAGGFCVLIEIWVNLYFSIIPRALWSIYPAGTALLLGAVFVLLHRSRTLKAALIKKLFV